MIASGAPEYARLDDEGNLVDATARLIDLNARAGGAVGAPIVLPGLAAVARLVASLKVPVARGIVVADGETDAMLQVSGRPDARGVVLDVSDWSPRPARRRWLIDQPEPPVVREALPWRWAIDATLVLTALDFAPDDVGELVPGDVIGRPLTRLVRLIEDDDGDLPILASLAAGRGFEGQRAVRRDRPDTELVLRGQALHDPDGTFMGFAGEAVAAVPRPVAIGTTDHGGGILVEKLGQVLRQPLDRIITRADSIAAQTDGPLRRDYADYAGDIATAGRHLLELVDDLADLQAVDRNDFTLETEPVDLADIARRAAGLLSVRGADRQIRIDRPDLNDVLMARGDFTRALQILVNLLGNAVRYSPQGSMIWLRTELDGDSAVVVVADQGRGIAPADHDRVFAKFERLDASEPGGSGLGLYISRRLARAMGGDITLDSAPGQGARFILTLPAA